MSPSPHTSALAAVLALAGACGCAHREAAGEAAGPATDVPIELTLPAARGQPIDLAALRGNVVIIDVMATWSVACQAELPTFRKLLAGYGDRGLRIVSIAMDSQTPTLVRTYLETLDVAWPVALATSEVIEGRSPLGRVPEVPRTLVLDRKGFVRFDRAGVVDAAALAAAIERLL